MTYFEVKNKSITLQCFAEKQKYHVSNENSCVTVVQTSKDKLEYHVWHFNVLSYPFTQLCLNIQINVYCIPSKKNEFLKQKKIGKKFA